VATTDVPTQAELIRRANEIGPVLRANAAWTEENRRLHEESIEAMADAGIFKLRVPTQYGGYEVNLDTLVDIGAALGRGDGSTAWVVSVSWVPGWMVGTFPDEAQDEVFATENVRVCGTLSPQGMAAPAPGGIVVNGKWGFISGAHHAHWQEIISILVPENGEPYPVMALVPMSELEIVDDWYVSGLRGTGSVTTIAKDVFIPEHRVMPLMRIMTGDYASANNAGKAMFRAPLLGTANASANGAVWGLAQAAWEHFFERLPDRKITFSDYASQREAPVTHMRVARTALLIDQLEFHARRCAKRVDRKADTGEPWKLLDRAESRADVGALVELGKQAIDQLAVASGGSSIYDSVPIQRINRDIQAINLHALMTAEANLEVYGRVLCGLEPNSSYI
jgi:alkylation response protein AidB-like acyl-CoA dehydrogenase